MLLYIKVYKVCKCTIQYIKIEYYASYYDPTYYDSTDSYDYTENMTIYCDI